MERLKLSYQSINYTQWRAKKINYKLNFIINGRKVKKIKWNVAKDVQGYVTEI